MSSTVRKYRFALINSRGIQCAQSNVYTDSVHTPNLNKNLARWVSYGFPDCSGEQKGAGIIITGDQIAVEYVDYEGA